MTSALYHSSSPNPLISNVQLSLLLEPHTLHVMGSDVMSFKAENSHPLMPPLLFSVQLWVHSHYNPLCSLWCTYLQGGGVNIKSVLSGILNQKWLPTADNCSVNNTWPVISHSAAFALNSSVTHSSHPTHNSLPAVRSSGTDSEGNFGSTFQLARIPRLPFFNKNGW